MEKILEKSEEQIVSDLITSYSLSQIIYVSAKLGVFDVLAEGEKSSEEIAAIVHAHPGTLYRFLRGLACIGLLREARKNVFALTSRGEHLLSGDPQSLHMGALMCGEEQYRAWGEALYAVKTGKPAFDHIYGVPAFEYLSAQSAAGRIFNATMASSAARERAAVLATYDLAGCEKIIDVGGGDGTLIASLLQLHPGLRGALFDLPTVVKKAEQTLQLYGVADRCEVIPGSFFESIPTHYDAYIFSRVLHDWDDENALKILHRCRESIAENARILILERILPGHPIDGSEVDRATFKAIMNDLNVLIMTGGRERSSEDFAGLLAGASFRLARTLSTTYATSILEGFPV